VVENYYSLAGLNVSEASRAHHIAEQITLAADFKWTLVFLALGILSAIFLRFYWSNLWNLASASLLLGAIAGIIGVFVYPFKIIFGMELINAALLMSFITLVAAGIAFQFGAVRQHFLRGY
jgi:hypothetical protein